MNFITEHPALRKSLRATLITAVTLLGLILIAYMIYVYLFYPREAEPFEISTLGAEKSILIATQKTEFKDALIRVLCDSLKRDSVSIRGIDLDDLYTVHPDEWDRILLVNSFIINLNRDIRSFIDLHPVEDKTLVLVTSGGADWEPEKDLEVDAITSASRKVYIPQITDLILSWMRAELPFSWKDHDQLLSLKYFPQVDVQMACDLIRSEHQIYAQHYPKLRKELNGIGYMFLRLDRIKDALEVFELNIEMYPDKWNVYDSYAEALMINGDQMESIKYYKIALEMNPDASSARSALSKLLDE